MKRAKASKGRRRRVPGKYQKWLLPILALAAVGAAFLVFNFANSELRTELPVDSYQFTLGAPNHFPAGTRLIESDTGLLIETDTGRSNSDATPFYAEGSRSILLSRDVCWADAASHREALVPALSTVEIDKNGTIWCQVGENSYPLKGGFLTDGRGTVVFLDDVKLSVNGVFQDLPALSFYSDVGGICRVWSYGDEAVTRVNSLIMNTVAVSSLGYEVDLTAGIFSGADGVRRLLSSSPSTLPDLATYF